LGAARGDEVIKQAVETSIRIHKGSLVDFEIYPNRLVIRLTEIGKQETAEWDLEDQRCDIGMFFDLCEDQLCNGWREVRPEQVGDLRDDAHLTFTDDYTFADPNRDDEMIVGTAYHFDRYAINGYMETIMANGFITFERHDFLTPEEMNAACEEIEKKGEK
jgi:hypothetical protein